MKIWKKDATAEEARLRTILDAMVEAVYVTDSKGRVTLTNNALDKLMAGDVRGRRAKNVIKSKVLRSAIRRARKKNVAGEIELEHQLGDRLYAFQAQVSPLPNGEGVVTVLHDVTRLKSTDRIRRDFVANASHELRTPLTAIRSFAETLRDGTGVDSSTSERFLDAILRHVHRLQRLAEDLTALAQAESLQLSYDSVETDVGELARECVASLEGAADSKGMTITYDMPSKPVVLDLSPRALDHALLNLVQNAIKYAPEGTAVTIRMVEEKDQVLLEVRDQGPGIPEALRTRIFERFYRIDSGRSRADGGTGLGLAIARNMIERVGGTVEVDSTVGKGSCFRIILPKDDDY